MTDPVSSSGNTYIHGPRRLGRRLPLHLAVAGCYLFVAVAGLAAANGLLVGGRRPEVALGPGGVGVGSGMCVRAEVGG